MIKRRSFAKKRSTGRLITLIFCLILISVPLTACGCEHSWCEKTATIPLCGSDTAGTRVCFCLNCGETKEEILAMTRHNMYKTGYDEEGCYFDRFDSHQGLHNATVKIARSASESS